MGWLTNLDNKRSLKKLQKIADEIDSLEDKYLNMTDEELLKYHNDKASSFLDTYCK